MKRSSLIAVIALASAPPVEAQQTSGAMLPARASIGGARLNGTGAPTPASLADRATDGGVTFNLKEDFGAKCDGATDDTGAIQAWLNKAGPGVKLVAPAGVCRFSSPLAAPTASGFALAGAGAGATVFRYTGPSTASNLITLGSATETGTAIWGWSVSTANPVTGSPVWQNGAALTPSLALAEGGTSATTAAGARAALHIPGSSPLDRGAACDGATDDTAAVLSAASAGTIMIPGAATLCSTTIGFTHDPQASGPGRLIRADNNLTAPVVTNLSAPPSSLGTWSYLGAAFNGDLSHTWQPHLHIITGGATLGAPTTGYAFAPETTGSIHAALNQSGYNYAHSGNTGRTASADTYYNVAQLGQGDFAGIWCSGSVNAAPTPGDGQTATSYLAAPAVECLGGELWGQHDGDYIEYLGDMDITDSGTSDIAAVGEVFGLARTVAREGIGANWVGRFVSSAGTAPLDAGDKLAGPMVVGYDMTNVTMGYYRLASYTPTFGTGSGYKVGDVLQISGGTVLTNGPATTIQVTSVSGGAVTGTTVVNTGIYTTAPTSSYTNVTTTDLTTPAASGVVISAAYAANDAIRLPATGGCIRPGVSTGSPVTEMSGVYSALCITQNGLSFGGSQSLGSSGGAENVLLGDRHVALGKNNVMEGQLVYDQAQNNAWFWSSGSFAGTGGGVSQTSLRIFRAAGSGTLRLTSDANAPGLDNTYLAPASSAHAVGWRCNAISTANTSNTATWTVWRSGALTANSAGTVAYAGDGTAGQAPDQSTGNGLTARITLAADATYHGLSVTFAPPAGDTSSPWRAQCRLDIDQLGGG